MQLPTPRNPISAVMQQLRLVGQHGGQHTARRNAWAGTVAAAARTRDRAEAEAALEVVLRHTNRQVAAGR